MHPPKALRELLLQQGPKEEPLTTLVGAQLVLHRAVIRVLVPKQVRRQDRRLTRVRLSSKGLVVRNNARDSSPRPDEVEDIEGHVEPLVPAVEEVKVAVHLLDQGGVERLGRVVGGQGRGP